MSIIFKILCSTSWSILWYSEYINHSRNVKNKLYVGQVKIRSFIHTTFQIQYTTIDIIILTIIYSYVKYMYGIVDKNMVPPYCNCNGPYRNHLFYNLMWLGYKTYFYYMVPPIFYTWYFGKYMTVCTLLCVQLYINVCTPTYIFWIYNKFIFYVYRFPILCN